jgi:hypothetical protein
VARGAFSAVGPTRAARAESAVVRNVLARAQTTARAQGHVGARWPKQVGPDGREAPSNIGPFLVWQQPHPLYLAELVYRSRRDRQTLERWAPIVFETAAFMASFATPGEMGFELGSASPERGSRTQWRDCLARLERGDGSE